MFLTRLIYTSSITKAFTTEDIELILASARKNNDKLNVTGMLCFNRKYFLQCLEGSRADVNTVYHRILNDTRHGNIIMLDYQEISARKFSEWSMGYMPESTLTEPINLKYSGSKIFYPYEMSGDSAFKMMPALKDAVPII